MIWSETCLITKDGKKKSSEEQQDQNDLGEQRPMDLLFLKNQVHKITAGFNVGSLEGHCWDLFFLFFFTWGRGDPVAHKPFVVLF